jgi:hypothetical protein
LAAGSHCRWCDAKASCPVIHAKAQEVASLDFSAIAPAEVLLPTKSMTIDQMARTLEWEEMVLGLFDDIRQRLKAELEAGREVPGFKLVEGKSNRKWIDENTVVKEFAPLLGEEALYEKKLLSPAKLEKIVGKKGGKLDHLTFKPEASKTLARDTDPRPATKSSAQEDFGGQSLLEQLGPETKKQHDTDPLDGLM